MICDICLEQKIYVTQKQFENKIIDVCYNRNLCEQLEITYEDIRREDIRKIKNYLREIYEIKEQ